MSAPSRRLVTDAVFEAFLGAVVASDLDEMLNAWADAMIRGALRGAPDGCVALITAELTHRAVEREVAIGRWTT